MSKRTKDKKCEKCKNSKVINKDSNVDTLKTAWKMDSLSGNYFPLNEALSRMRQTADEQKEMEKKVITPEDRYKVWSDYRFACKFEEAANTQTAIDRVLANKLYNLLVFDSKVKDLLNRHMNSHMSINKVLCIVTVCNLVTALLYAILKTVF